MHTLLWIFGAILSAIPCVIAYKRKCRNLVLIDLLSFFLSWTIIGWVAAMFWAVWGESESQPDRPKANTSV
jgi:hypothetical protein